MNRVQINKYINILSNRVTQQIMNKRTKALKKELMYYLMEKRLKLLSIRFVWAYNKQISTLRKNDLW